MEWGGMEGRGTKRTNYRTKMERKVLFIPPFHRHILSPPPPHQNSSSGVLFQKNKIRNTSCLASTNKQNFQIPGPPTGQFENWFSNKCQQIAINDALTKKKRKKDVY
ncbi:hypothetical protein CEXT_309501 [Caerostris extrusa]|uniref:Uncharacterized protein n=1 Tax=Caerostris extrusa TaxID=172846 RepID=A0AAV4RGH4_CAEEX|nr:hypothetical protein CEXT_309501 [Caerostris extrusa]